MRANLLIYYILFIYSDYAKTGAKNTKKMIRSEFIAICSEFIAIRSEFIVINYESIAIHSEFIVNYSYILFL